MEEFIPNKKDKIQEEKELYCLAMSRVLGILGVLGVLERPEAEVESKLD